MDIIRLWLQIVHTNKYKVLGRYLETTCHVSKYCSTHSFCYTMAVGTVYSSELVWSTASLDHCQTTGRLGLALKFQLCHVTCVMLNVSWHMCHVTCVLLHVSCYKCHDICVMLHVLCYMCHVTYVMLHASCYMCHEQNSTLYDLCNMTHVT